MEDMYDFGTCSHCGSELEPVWFTEEEFKIEHGMMYKTGRKRRNIDVLVCPVCLKNHAVDDTFAGPWRNT